MPIGLYVARPVPIGFDHPVRGTIVTVCLPDPLARWGWARGYIMRGGCRDGLAPVGKPVFAVAGDTVVVGAFGLARNGRSVPNTVSLERDRSGRPLPRLSHGRYPVGNGQLWLVSTYTAVSWDSRYYGALPASSIIAELRPLLVAGETSRR